MVADAAFANSGAFQILLPIPVQLLVEKLCHAVLDYLVEGGAITEGFANRLLVWEYSGNNAIFKSCR